MIFNLSIYPFNKGIVKWIIECTRQIYVSSVGACHS